MERVARSGSRGVSSECVARRTKIPGRYVASLSPRSVPHLRAQRLLSITYVLCFRRVAFRGGDGGRGRSVSFVGSGRQSFLTLPDANKVSFVDADAVDLSPLLPNLPPSTSNICISLDTRTHVPGPDPGPSPLDLIHRFLVYEPARRLHPSDALRHPWFRAEPGLVLPADDDRTGQHPPWVTDAQSVTHTFTLEGRTCTLGELLQRHITSRGGVVL